MTYMRAGDTVLARLHISRINSAGGTMVKVENYPEFVLPPSVVERVVVPVIALGDRVSWGHHPGNFGTVIGLQLEGEEFWVWVQEDGRWPRLTFQAKELRRLDP